MLNVYVFGSGRCEWIIGLCLGFTNPVGLGGVLDVLACGGVGVVGGEWVGGLDQGLEGWCGLMYVLGAVSLDPLCGW